MRWHLTEENKWKQTKLYREQRERIRFPEDQRGVQLSPSERCIRVLNEIHGVKSMYGINEWEMSFLSSNRDSTYKTFTAKMETIMRRIEQKVFPEEAEDRNSVDAEDRNEYEELDGNLRFKK